MEILTWFQLEKATTVQVVNNCYSYLRDFRLSSLSGANYKGLLETPRTSWHYGIEGYQGGSQLISHYKANFWIRGQLLQWRPSETSLAIPVD